MKVDPLPAEEALRVTLAAAVSTMLTFPLEFAVNAVASVSAIEIPPVPLVRVSVGALMAATVVIEPVPPGVALSVIDLEAERLPVSATLPPVDDRLRLGADKLVRPVSVILLNAFTLI